MAFYLQLAMMSNKKKSLVKTIAVDDGHAPAIVLFQDQTAVFFHIHRTSFKHIIKGLDFHQAPQGSGLRFPLGHHIRPLPRRQTLLKALPEAGQDVCPETGPPANWQTDTAGGCT